jgi:hypothetical protein
MKVSFMPMTYPAATLEQGDLTSIVRRLCPERMVFQEVHAHDDGADEIHGTTDDAEAHHGRMAVRVSMKFVFFSASAICGMT